MKPSDVIPSTKCASVYRILTYLGILVLFSITNLCNYVQFWMQCGTSAAPDKPRADDKSRDPFQFGVDFARAPEAIEFAPFDWNQVNLTQPGNCGMTKCFFDAVNATDDSPVGYLIANQNKYEKMRKVSQLADWMASALGAKHFNAEPAYLVNVSLSQIRLLNDLVYQPLRIYSNQSTKDIYLETDRAVVIQKVHKAPTPAITFGRRQTKMQSLPTVLPDFCVHVPDRDAMAAQLAREREVLWRTLLHVPALWRDLQGMVDVYGNFFFIDLDGAVSKIKISEQRRMWNITECMDQYDSFVHQVLECIDDNKKWLHQNSTRSSE